MDENSYLNKRADISPMVITRVNFIKNRLTNEIDPSSHINYYKQLLTIGHYMLQCRDIESTPEYLVDENIYDYVRRTQATQQEKFITMITPHTLYEELEQSLIKQFLSFSSQKNVRPIKDFIKETTNRLKKNRDEDGASLYSSLIATVQKRLKRTSENDVKPFIDNAIREWANETVLNDIYKGTRSNKPISLIYCELAYNLNHPQQTWVEKHKFNEPPDSQYSL